MRHCYLLAAFIGFGTMSPALAQKIAPSVTYNESAPTPLDKNFGLPSFGMQGAGLPQQRTMAPVAKPRSQPDPFTDPLGPGPSESEDQDFFKPSPGLSSTDTGVQDFFKESQESALPKSQLPARGYSTPDYTTTDTPLFTTGQGDADQTATSGLTTGDMTTGSFGTGDAGDATSDTDK